MDHAVDETVVLAAADEDDGVANVGAELDDEGLEEGVEECAWVETRGWCGGCVALGVECCLSGSILVVVDRRIRALLLGDGLNVTEDILVLDSVLTVKKVGHDPGELSLKGCTLFLHNLINPLLELFNNRGLLVIAVAFVGRFCLCIDHLCAYIEIVPK